MPIQERVINRARAQHTFYQLVEIVLPDKLIKLLDKMLIVAHFRVLRIIIENQAKNSFLKVNIKLLQLKKGKKWIIFC